MKSLVSILTLGFLFAFCAPAFAGKTYTTEATCEKAHMKWDANSKTCSTRSYAYHPKRSATSLADQADISASRPRVVLHCGTGEQGFGHRMLRGDADSE